MSRKDRKTFAQVEANLTPMIDVTFLLIVFFVLVSQIVDVENVPMSLPEPKHPATIRPGEEQRAVINVLPGPSGGVDGYRLGTSTYGTEQSELEALADHLTRLMTANPQLAVNLRADRAAHYRFVEPVLQAVSVAASHVPERAAGARVNLVVVNEET